MTRTVTVRSSRWTADRHRRGSVPDMDRDDPLLDELRAIHDDMTDADYRASKFRTTIYTLLMVVVVLLTLAGIGYVLSELP